ncbi:DNA cytosine methyltransferase [Parasphingopyxis marina]|uniref:Cytosine-specific methyltransferase n=1 Tax=Parasphingopyxis marina TaxID=2761622 RepID=A0A842HXH2_9SPHN|nr:DNA cytosine methyltransferase [Parasphingopyxis marina]MBC2777127.1 DNA cytosine methyltransferase [Parasphingopyxis marina]
MLSDIALLDTNRPNTDDSDKTKLVAVDLFAGAGGFSLGAIQAELHVAAALEYDTHASTTYRENIQKKWSPDTKVIAEDIIEFGPMKFLEETGLQQGDCDILLGGPPCQGFSQHRLHDSGIDDPRNALLLRYFDYVKALKPTLFLIENVPGLLRTKHEHYLKRLYDMAKKADYVVEDPVVLNARDFGVPQNRKRVFILGRHKRKLEKGVDWPPEATHHKPTEVGVNKKLSWKTAAAAFRPTTANDPNAKHMNSGPLVTAALASTPHNGGSRHESSRELECHKNHDGHKDVYGRIDSNKPGPTMTTACVNPSKGRFVHPTEDHGITVRQAARLQTFPDQFVFHGGLMAAGKQIGNAVPVEMARVLCEFLVDQLK